MRNAILSGGGTGGHLFAAIAFAEFLKKNGINPIIVGSEYGIEKKILKNYRFDYFLLKTKGVAGKRLTDKIEGTLLILKSTADSFKIIKKTNPIFSLGFGGYASFPVIVASRIAGVRTGILEQNSIPGKSNRILSKLCDITFLNFEITKQYMDGVVVGNPTRIKPVKPLREPKSPFTIGVIGGSRGARSINNAMIELSKHDLDVDIIHQTGEEDFERVKESYRVHRKSWKVERFIYNMEEFYGKIDFIICRAGASTLSEIACSGLGSILIPYPYAIYNHQYFNAKYFYDNEAAYLIEDRDLTGKKLFSIISSLTADKLKEMSKNAWKLCRQDSCEKMLKLLLKVNG